MMRPRRSEVAVVAFWVVLAGACSGFMIDTREYVLSADIAPSERPKDASGPGPVLAVGPVVMPSYLRRRQIVTREEGNRVEASSLHQWAEDLEAGVTRCLAEHLAAMVPADRVERFPWASPVSPDVRVTVEVERFERAGDEVALQARWVLTHPVTREPARAGQVVLREAVEGPGFPETVAAMSRAVGSLAREIAAAIRVQQGSPSDELTGVPSDAADARRPGSPGSQSAAAVESETAVTRESSAGRP